MIKSFNYSPLNEEDNTPSKLTVVDSINDKYKETLCARIIENLKAFISISWLFKVSIKSWCLINGRAGAVRPRG